MAGPATPPSFPAHRAGLEHLAMQIDLARENRDAAIRAAYTAGMPAAEIAKATGVTRGRVHQLVAGIDRPAR